MRKWAEISKTRSAEGGECDSQYFTVEIIHHVKGTEAPITPQRIAHEICCPTLIHALIHLQRRTVIGCHSPERASR